MTPKVLAPLNIKDNHPKEGFMDTTCATGMLESRGARRLVDMPVHPGL